MNRKILSAVIAATLAFYAIPAASLNVSAEWVENDNGYSYVNDVTGEIYVGWKNIGKKRYYFGRDGIMRIGWQNIGGKTYYFGRNGVMRTGWRKIGGNQYYFDINGRMATGYVTIGGIRYYFDRNGVLNGNNSEKAELTAGGVLDRIKKELGSSYTCDNVCSRTDLENVGFDMRYIDSFAYENNAISSINADIAIIVKAKNGYADKAADIMQEYYEQIYNTMQLYSADLYRVEQARIFVSGDYAALLILGGYGDWEQTEEEQSEFAFSEAIKVDNAWKKIFGSIPENRAEIPEGVGSSLN